MKKYFAIFSILALAAFASTTAFADSISDVDDNSTAAISHDSDAFASIWNSNTAITKNYVNTETNTGSNSVSSDDDVEGTSIATGAAGSLLGISNTVNANFVDLTVTNEGCGCDDSSIEEVDDESTAVISTESDSKARLSNWNFAYTKNHVSTLTKTGSNSVSGDGAEDTTVDTGDSVSAAALDNVVNVNDVQVVVRRMLGASE